MHNLPEVECSIQSCRLVELGIVIYLKLSETSSHYSHYITFNLQTTDWPQGPQLPGNLAEASRLDELMMPAHTEPCDWWRDGTLRLSPFKHKENGRGGKGGVSRPGEPAMSRRTRIRTVWT